MRLNVLVFPCGSEIGLEIHSALRSAKDVRLHGASSVSDHGEFVYARYRRIDAHAGSADLIAELDRLCTEWKIDIVLPAHDSLIPLLAEARGRMQAVMAVPDAQTAVVCRNKNLTYARLRHLGFVPADAGVQDVRYPIFAKPAVGQGSQGAERVDDADRHRALRESGVEYVFSEYLPGDEYTVDCISSAGGGLLHAAPRSRERIKSGISVRSMSLLPDEAILEMAASIAAELQLIGAWFFQVRRDRDGHPKLLEVAPRIAGSMGLSRMRGINYPLLTIYAHLGRPFGVLPMTHDVQLDRALCSRYRTNLDYQRVYLDLDDTLLLEDHPHPALMALLYQWQSRSVEVVLLTRHAADPAGTLESHHIHAGLFASIIHLIDGSPKSAAITTELPSIFIDDSFRERRDVHLTHAIPAFDVDAIEQLLDPRA